MSIGYIVYEKTLKETNLLNICTFGTVANISYMFIQIDIIHISMPSQM